LEKRDLFPVFEEISICWGSLEKTAFPFYLLQALQFDHDGRLEMKYK